jgi:thiamine monophosphate kinase
MQTAISSDMLVEGRHFFAGEDPARLGHKALAVNLSDLAAMGARPVGFTLALALPDADRDWLAGFSQGLFALADAFDIELIGGDTTKGPLQHLHHRVWRSAPRPGAAPQRRQGPATTSGSPAPWATPAWRWPATGWN